MGSRYTHTPLANPQLRRNVHWQAGRRGTGGRGSNTGSGHRGHLAGGRLEHHSYGQPRLPGVTQQ
eukprot:2493690-Lingulodinium_polyedra.AAC.1